MARILIISTVEWLKSKFITPKGNARMIAGLRPDGEHLTR